MIDITIELHSARTGKRTLLGRMSIVNDGTSKDPTRGSYDVTLYRRGSKVQPQRTGRVEDYPRLAYPVWELLRRAIEAAQGKGRRRSAR